MSHLLLYADVDLNLIDGSSVWLASLAELLANADELTVTVLQRTPIQRSVVVQQLQNRPNIQFVDPWDTTDRALEWVELLLTHKAPRLTAQMAARFIQMLDHQHHFDHIIVRSLETAQLLSEVSPVASRLWVYITDPMRHDSTSEREKLRGIFGRVQRFLCQTEEARGVFRDLLQTSQQDKLALLPPMIPAIDRTARPLLDPAAPRLGYAGKFSPPYMILEMLDAFEEIRARVPNAEFHVVGDKFHNFPPHPGFEQTVKDRLQTMPGVVWHGGVSREETHEILRRVHVASSWRDTLFDDSLEMSTKILEYSALGIPVLMNPSAVQARIYGSDYPAYVESKEQFVATFIKLTSSQSLYQATSRRVQDVAANFTFERTLDNLMPLLNTQQGPKQQGPESSNRRTTLLFAGHDFKFLRPIMEYFQNSPDYEVLVDHYQGHVIRNPEQSAALLAQADLIFCEWCLGNAEWYSRHKQAGQRLVVRLHHQELDLDYLERINWNHVDQLIFICPQNMEQFLARFPLMASRSTLLYNPIDCDALDLPKLPGAEFNLGLIGTVPKRKAPHLAFEILERLKAIDKRYTLFVKGKHAWEYDWLWRQPEEQCYYKELYLRRDHSAFANSVTFDPFGDDVAIWLSKIGFVLSTSDHEGSHQAVAEGMASGAIPIIRNWKGADAIYPPKYVFRTADEAVELILKWNTTGNYLQEYTECKNLARQKFDQALIIQQVRKLFAQLLAPMVIGAEK